MRDQRNALEELDRVAAPDVWEEAQFRAERVGFVEYPPLRGRAAPMVVGLALAALASIVAVRSFAGGGLPAVGGGGEEAEVVEGDAFVIEAPPAGPTMCLGTVNLTAVPQCEGATFAIANWNWAEVDDEQRYDGAAWGNYHVTGILDGQEFTLTRAPEPAIPHDGQSELDSACPEPTGGWHVPDPSKTSRADLEAAAASVRGDSQFAGLWVSRIDSMVVLNAAFVDTAEGHEAALREHWGGALCLVTYQRPYTLLEEAQQEVVRDAGSLGLQVLTTEIDEAENRVDVGVVVEPPSGQEALDAQFGDGTIELTPALTAIADEAAR